MTRVHHLPDTKQTAWQLASIQLTGMASLPVLAASVLLLQVGSFSSAVVTILFGNALLWLIRWGIVVMSQKGRKSTLDISKDYVGRIGGYLIAVVLLGSTLAWFVAQTTLACNALLYLIPFGEHDGINRFVQVSVALGILSTVFCMEGIVVLRWLAVVAFPILVLAFFGVMLMSSEAPVGVEGTKLTLAGLPLVLGTSLGVTADLPTFFRHSQSKKTSMQALTIIQVISLVIGFCGLYLGSVIKPWFGVVEAGGFALHSEMLRFSLIALILVSVLCANVSNVYSSSVGWEIIAPVLAGRKEYLILGLGLSTVFILIANIFNMEFLINATDSALVNLCFILLVGYLIQLSRKRPPSVFEQGTYLAAWFVATVINVLQYAKVWTLGHSPLVVSLAFIVGIVILGTAFQRLVPLKRAVR